MSKHTVTITEVPPDTDDFEWTCTCPGDGTCAVWYECSAGKHEPTEDEDMDGNFTAHGVHHQYIDGSWMTETNQCALSSTDSGAQGMTDVAHTVGVGTHEVDVSYWGDGHWDVTLIPTEATP